MLKIATVHEDKPGSARLDRLLSPLGSCFHLHDSEAMLMALRKHVFDFICIDWDLLDNAGLTRLIGRIRAVSEAPWTPIMLVASRFDDDDIVYALTAGADDFLSKTIHDKVFLARVGALLRRLNPQAATSVEFYEPYEFDHMRNVVAVSGRENTLTSKEFHLAVVMFRNMGRSLSRDFLARLVWGMVDRTTRTLDVHISRIRNKLCLTPENGYILRSIVGFGYRLDRLVAGDVDN